MLVDPDWQRKRRHWQRIVRFAERQRAARQWIPLSEIAEWCARSVTGANAAAEQDARDLAYKRLDQAARQGEFEQNIFRAGRIVKVSELRYLDPEVPCTRIAREQLAYIKDIGHVAAYCWLPRKAAWQWLAAHGYRWPAHFDPSSAGRKHARPGPPELCPAIQAAIKQHGYPGKSVQWARFCDHVRALCNVSANTRGYSDKSITRAVRRLMAGQDKTDIADRSDMSC